MSDNNQICLTILANMSIHLPILKSSIDKTFVQKISRGVFFAKVTSTKIWG